MTKLLLLLWNFCEFCTVWGTCICKYWCLHVNMSEYVVSIIYYYACYFVLFVLKLLLLQFYIFSIWCIVQHRWEKVYLLEMKNNMNLYIFSVICLLKVVLCKFFSFVIELWHFVGFGVFCIWCIVPQWLGESLFATDKKWHESLHL